MITEPRPYQMHTKPYEHQQAAFIDSRNRKIYAPWWEMGTGKSKLIIDTVGYLFCQQEIDGVILVGDKGNYLNWYGEIEKHLPPTIQRRAAHWASHLDRGEKWRLEQLMAAKDNVLDFFLINVEAFSSGRVIQTGLRFIRGHYVFMLVDEATSIKSPKSQRHRGAKSLGQHCEYKRVMTGTPVAESPLDLYGICEFLGKELLGFPTYTSFRAHFCQLERQYLGPGRPSFDIVIGYKNLEHLTQSLDAFSSRITKDQCLDLPDKVYETRDVELTDEQQVAYNAVRDTAVLQLEEGLMTSTAAVTTLNKLQQIVCGHVKLDDGTIAEIPSNRTDIVLDILGEIGSSKCIIWCAFQKDVELVARAIREWKKNPYCVVEFYGLTSDKDRVTAKDRFQNDPTCLYWVGTQSSGGKGNTLTAATYEIFYSNTYRLEHRLQAEDRAHRIGQTQKVTIIDLVARKTVDERIRGCQIEKQDLASQVLGNMKKLLFA